MTPGQVQALANDLRSSDASTRIEAVQYIGKFVLEPAEALIKYITEGDCILALTVSNSSQMLSCLKQRIANDIRSKP